MKVEIKITDDAGNIRQYVVICWRIFTRKLQSEQGVFNLFLCGGQKIFFLIISDLENISKKVTEKLVYIIYLMYICIIKFNEGFD